MLQQGAAGLRRGHALAAAHQKLGAEGQFHLADAGRGRRQREIGALGAMGDTARLDDVAEKIEVREVEAHDGATFLFYEGRLRKTQIVPSETKAQASYSLKYPL